MGRGIASVLGLLAMSACGAPPVEELPPGSFAFAVFGDGPYRGWEQGRYRALLRDIGNNEVDFMIHVGDAFWFPCSESSFEGVLEDLNSLAIPVVYTPGDNEWADCHGEFEGGYEPLERLSVLRQTLFSQPTRSLGGDPMVVESQGTDSVHFEFVENARWTTGPFLFSTIHFIGGNNGGAPFPGRSADDDNEVERRTAAALQWLDDAFTIARRDSLAGIVIAIHADPDFDDASRAPVYSLFLDRIRTHTAAFPGQVLLVHGDDHELHVDHPLLDSLGATLDNFTRLETFGSPDIGWVRVVVDTLGGTFAGFEPRLMRGWGW